MGRSDRPEWPPGADPPEDGKEAPEGSQAPRWPRRGPRGRVADAGRTIGRRLRSNRYINHAGAHYRRRARPDEGRTLLTGVEGTPTPTELEPGYHENGDPEGPHSMEGSSGRKLARPQPEHSPYSKRRRLR